MVFVRPHFYSNCSCRNILPLQHVHKTKQSLLKMLHFETFFFVVVVLRLTTPSVYLLLVQKIHSCRHSQSFSPTLIYEIPSATGMCCHVKTLRAVAVDIASLPGLYGFPSSYEHAMLFIRPLHWYMQDTCNMDTNVTAGSCYINLIIYFLTEYDSLPW